MVDDLKLSQDQLKVGKYIYQVDRIDHAPGERWKGARLQSITELAPGDEVVAMSGSAWQYRLVVDVNEATRRYTVLEFVPDPEQATKKLDKERAYWSDAESNSTEARIYVMEKLEIKKKLEELTKPKHHGRKVNQEEENTHQENPNSILQRCGVLHFHTSMNLADQRQKGKKEVDSEDSPTPPQEPLVGIIQRKVKKFSNRLYKIFYQDDICLETEQTLINAYRLVDAATEKWVELHYDMYKNNNEHFTTWCKTGYGYSTQTGYEQIFYDEEAMNEINGKLRLPRARELTFAEKIQESYKAFQESIHSRFSKVSRQFVEVKYDIMDVVDSFKGPERRTLVINNFDATRENEAPGEGLTIKIGDIVVLIDDPDEDGWVKVRHDERPDEIGFVPFSCLQIANMVT